jgi:hypothetical protein
MFQIQSESFFGVFKWLPAGGQTQHFQGGTAGASASVLLFCCALHGLDHAYNGLQRFPEPKQGDKQDKEDEQHRPAGA